ncbi:MAG: hypothetical protein P8J87_13930, partial [Verrucomicrobiales bacterium]|nr:hypothetical protein [Verrucomicrobiales bacterium]
MKQRLVLLLGAVGLGLFGVSGVSCSSTSDFTNRGVESKKVGRIVRTTAYCHLEADSLKYGKLNAVGTQLKYGKVRSAAADWSQYPVGTVFKIKGEPYLYEVDDYGSALVGTNTIDLYKPTKPAMHAWGVRGDPMRADTSYLVEALETSLRAAKGRWLGDAWLLADT